MRIFVGVLAPIFRQHRIVLREGGGVQTAGRVFFSTSCFPQIVVTQVCANIGCFCRLICPCWLEYKENKDLVSPQLNGCFAHPFVLAAYAMSLHKRVMALAISRASTGTSVPEVPWRVVLQRLAMNLIFFKAWRSPAESIARKRPDHGQSVHGEPKFTKDRQLLYTVPYPGC